MKLLVIQVAALSEAMAVPELTFNKTQSIFPAVTCSVQAAMRTASYSAAHGMIANGRYFRELHKPMFWEQSSDLVGGERIWEEYRRQGKKVAMLFWQQSLGEDVDIVLSPAPIHKHHGGMIMDCYSQPAGLYQQLVEKIGSGFKLGNYWGPLAAAKVGNWIVDATLEVLSNPELAPDLCFTYLPSLDYDLQRYQRQHKKCLAAVEQTEAQLKNLVAAARRAGYDVVIFGDYHISPVNQAIFPNRHLRDASFFKTRAVKKMEYPDFHLSEAFAVVDHEIAHVYIKNSRHLPEIQKLFNSTPGIAHAYSQEEMKKLHMNHQNSGELLLVAADGNWFAYPWWQEKKHAPDYATHIDIHNKPGYDPCELFSGWPPLVSVSLDTTRIMGSHGKTGEGRDVVWASTLDLGTPKDLVELASNIKAKLTG